MEANEMNKPVTRQDIIVFFAGWKFSDYFIFGCCVLAAFIAGIMVKGYYQ